MILNTVVETDPDRAFEVFTAGINDWWKRTDRHMFRREGDPVVRFEGDQLLEVHSDQTFVMGNVSAWEPGRRLVFSWFTPQPTADVAETEVEVRFEDLGGRTRVVLEHRGVAGTKVGDTISSVMGLWWSDLIACYRSSL